MRFIYLNVAPLLYRILNIRIINIIFSIFITIFTINIKNSSCILVSTKEGLNNSNKNLISGHFIKYSPTHFKNDHTNTIQRHYLHNNILNTNNSISRYTLKTKDSTSFAYVINHSKFISTHRTILPTSTTLLSKDTINDDLSDQLSYKNSNSTLTHSLNPISDESFSSHTFTNVLKQPSKNENIKIRESKHPFKHFEPYKLHSISDIDIGLIKNINCNRVIDVKSIFGDIFNDESGQLYGSYKEKILKLLAKELESGGYDKAIDLLYNRWKNMDAVAVSRGFRILFNEQWMSKRFHDLVQMFIHIIPSRFVADIYSFEIAMRAINRAYVDGWVLSLIFISTMKSFGIEFFKRVSVFSDFKSTVDGDIFKNRNSYYKRNLGYELHDSNKNRLTSIDSLYNSAIYSCFSSGNFSILMSLYYEKLWMNSLMSSELDVNYKPDLNEGNKNKLLNFTDNYEHGDRNEFDKLISHSLSIMPETNVSYDLDIIQNDLVSLKSLEPTEAKTSDWSVYLILNHSLNNLFSTNEIIVTNDQNSGSSVFVDSGSKLQKLIKSRSNLDNLVQYSKDIISIISEKTLFDKNRAGISDLPAKLPYIKNNAINGILDPKLNLAYSDRMNLKADKGDKLMVHTSNHGSLEATIDYIRQFESSGRVIGVSDIYEFMRLLLRHKINGATALNMMFMLVPNLIFSKWCHYHMLLCCMEHDFETGDLDSIDELLQYMIKLSCKPDAGLYNRFFSMCNSLDKPLLVLKHFKIISENGINWEDYDRYTGQTKIRISFGLYEQIFISCLKTGNVKPGMRALKHLIESLKGCYKSIPSSTWKYFIKLIELTQADKSLMAILDQLSEGSNSAEMGTITPTYVEIPKHKSVIIRQIEQILDNHINAD